MNEKFMFPRAVVEWHTALMHRQTPNRCSSLKWTSADGCRAGWCHSMARVWAKKLVPPQRNAPALHGHRMGTGCIFPRTSEVDFIFGGSHILMARPSRSLQARQRNRESRLHPTGDHLLRRWDRCKARCGFTTLTVKVRLLRRDTLSFLGSRVINESFTISGARGRARISSAVICGRWT